MCGPGVLQKVWGHGDSQEVVKNNNVPWWLTQPLQECRGELGASLLVCVCMHEGQEAAMRGLLALWMEQHH